MTRSSSFTIFKIGARERAVVESLSFCNKEDSRRRRQTARLRAWQSWCWWVAEDYELYLSLAITTTLLLILLVALSLVLVECLRQGFASFLLGFFLRACYSCALVGCATTSQGASACYSALG